MADFFTTSEALTVALDVVEVGSPTESWNQDGQLTAQVTLACPWNNRLAVIQDIMGYGVYYPRYPLALALPINASITGFSREGSTANLRMVVPDNARITIQYGQGKSKSQSGVDIFSESLEPSFEFITLPFDKFRWANPTDGDKLIADEAPGKLIVGFDYVQTRYQLSSIPTAILNPGIVNQSTVFAATLGISFAPQTLLYMGSVPSRTIKSDGSAAWNMTSRFSFRAQGWNKFWRAKTQNWEQLYLYKGSSYNNFQAGNLSAVLVS